jgi:hypothetical protein
MSLAAFDPQELQQFTQAFEELFDTGDPVSMTSYYTEHAHLMGDGMPPIQTATPTAPGASPSTSPHRFPRPALPKASVNLPKASVK